MVAGTRLVHISVGLVLTLEHNSLVLWYWVLFKKTSYQPGPGSESFLKLSYQLWSWYYKVIHKVTLSFIPLSPFSVVSTK
jgi:hypothetical protein